MIPVSPLLFVLLLTTVNLGVIVLGVTYVSKMGKDCVVSSHMRVVSPVDSRIECASHCSGTDSCHSFKMVTSDCHLFLYNKTSHRVNKDKICAASEETIWIKSDSLCPEGFNGEFYGTKYKLDPITRNHDNAAAYCQSLGGFSRLAEMSHMVNISSSVAGIWLDGAQIPGSAEPAGGWKWSAADVDVDPSLWFSPAEPNNFNGSQSVIRMVLYQQKLNDGEHSNFHSALCECNSPFN